MSQGHAEVIRIANAGDITIDPLQQIAYTKNLYRVLIQITPSGFISWNITYHTNESN
jgi:hypothetical protein